MVEDDGIGMDENQVNSLLRGEYKTPETRTRNIGLANIRERLEFLYGQQIDLQSTLSEGYRISSAS